MNHLKGLHYNAVGIEHAFAKFMGKGIGQRGLPHDADVFRHGDIAELGEVVEQFAEHCKERVSHIQFATEENGSPSARIHSAIQGLDSLAKDMKSTQGEEPQDYHWLIVSNLVLAIGALLDQIGA